MLTHHPTSAPIPSLNNASPTSVLAPPLSLTQSPPHPTPKRYHSLTLTLLKASWRRAQQLVAERADAIRKVAAELLAAEDEKVVGKQLVEIIEVRA